MATMIDPCSDQCAVGPDGRLLDASEIEFRYDVDDPTPLPRVEHSQGSTPTAKEREFF